MDFNLIAGLDIEKTAEEIKKDLPKLQDLLNKDPKARLKLIAELDLEKTQQTIKSQLNDVTNRISIPSINIGVDVGDNNLTHLQDQIKATAKISDNNVNKIEAFRTSLNSIGMDSKSINEVIDDLKRVNVEIDSLSQNMLTKHGKKKDSEILSVTVSGIDESGNIVEYARQYKGVSGELIKEINKVSTAVQKENAQLEKLHAQHIKRRADLKNQVEQIYKAAIDPNATRSITNGGHLNELEGQYNKINKAINNMNSDSQQVFAEQEAAATELISTLKSTVKEYRNAENVQLSLAPDKLVTGTNKFLSQFKALEADIKKAGVESETLTQNVNDLNNIISRINNEEILDASELRNAFTLLRNTKNELESLEKIDTSNAFVKRLQVQSSVLKNEIEEFSSKNIGFDTFKSEIDGTTVSVETLLKSLGEIKNAADLNVVKAEFTGLKNTYKNASTDVTKFVNDVNRKLKTLNNLVNNNVFNSNMSDINVQFHKSKLNKIIAEYQDILTELNKNPNNNNLIAIIGDLKQLETEFSSVTTSAINFKNSLKQEQDVERLRQNISKLEKQIKAFRKSNPKAEKKYGEDFDRLLVSLKACADSREYQRINRQFQIMTKNVEAFGLKGNTMLGTLKNNIAKFTGWMSMTQAISKFTSEVREAIVELKEVDTLLTEISKANDTLSEVQLAQIGNNSFDTASKYGKKATDYLSGVQEMSRAGYYANAEAMGELSTAAQGAGDMTADVANAFIVATDKAYQMNGSVEELTETLDGINYITNHNAVNMTELSEGFSIVASTAASFGIEANQLTAALGTMASTTQQSGSEVARAFRAILLNIRQVSDEEEGIDAEGLTKYEKACNALGVSLKETENGVLQTRDAMEVLKELSVEYNKLSEDDLRRTGLLNSVGGKLRSTQLDALLRNWDTYEAMLQQYADGSGSMAKEAEKSANNLEGSLNRLSNTWVDTVENILNPDTMTDGINALNTILNIINSITESLGSIGSIGLGLGIFTGIKNVGSPKMFGLVLICQQQYVFFRILKFPYCRL